VPVPPLTCLLLVHVLLLLLLLQASSSGAGNRSGASSMGNIDDSNLDGFVHMNMIDDLLTE
jgi:hypothetical protein